MAKKQSKKTAESKTETRTLKDVKAELADVFAFIENLQAKHQQALQLKAQLQNEANQLLEADTAKNE